MKNNKKINKSLYRNYYIQEFQNIYHLLSVNHKKFIELNEQMYITNELIKKYPNENKMILKYQEVWYRIQYSYMSQLINHAWYMIDDIDKSCFPTIDFKYDISFRNMSTLFDIIHQIISNKIE
jgi:hypothetical protein